MPDRLERGAIELERLSLDLTELTKTMKPVPGASLMEQRPLLLGLLVLMLAVGVVGSISRLLES